MIKMKLMPMPSVGDRFVWVNPDYMRGRKITIKYIDLDYVMWVRDDGGAYVWPLSWWPKGAGHQFEPEGDAPAAKVYWVPNRKN